MKGLFPRILFVCLAATLLAQEAAPIEQVTNKLKTLAANPKLIQAVKEQNAHLATQAELDRIEQDWHSGNNTFSDKVLARPCSKLAQELVKQSDGLYREIFVMDAQGANVCMDSRTTYYDHGKMDKWSKAYNEGHGGVFYGKRTYDSSANSLEQQISVPIMDKGKAIGVLTVGVDMSQYKK